MAKTCRLDDGDLKRSNRRFWMAMAFVLATWIVAILGIYYIARYFDERRVVVKVQAAPMKMDFEWNCRVCGAENRVTEAM